MNALRAAIALAGVTAVLGGCTPGAPAADPSDVESPTDVATTPTETPTSAPPSEPTGASDTLPPLLAEPVFDEWPVPAGSRPHDAAPAPPADGRVWYAGQGSGEAGLLDPMTGEVQRIALGAGSSPHGVIVGEDGTAWFTDGGQNAIVAVDPDTLEVTTYPLPTSAYANLNTATFDGDGILWFTGQSGIYGRLDPASAAIEVFDAPRGRGPYGIATTPEGDVWFSSLAGSYIARITGADGTLEVVDTPTPGGGARRVWSDSRGRLWVTEWNAGNLAMYDPDAGTWQEWPLPGDNPQPYAVFVDDADLVWITDFGGDALVRFDPTSEEFTAFAWPTANAQVRQLLGRPGEVWGTGSATDTVIVLRTR